MSHVKFEYQNVASTYSNIRSTTDSIAELFKKIDDSMHDKVNVEDESIYGPLGSQLLLDWENTSSDFDDFVANFNNWSSAIASVGGNYGEFEAAVKGLKDANPLGFTSGGITQNYVASSSYNQYTAENKAQTDEAYANLNGLYELTAAEYVDTDSESILRRHRIISGIVTGADVLGLAWSAMAAYGLIFATPAASSTAMVPVEEGSTSLTTTGGTSGAGGAGGTGGAGTTGAGAGPTGAGPTGGGGAGGAGTTGAGAGTTGTGTAGAGASAGGANVFDGLPSNYGSWSATQKAAVAKEMGVDVSTLDAVACGDKAAYRSVAKLVHPDLHPGAESQYNVLFQILGEIWPN